MRKRQLSGRDHLQRTFNPLRYGFRWVGDWYEFDRPAAMKRALKARNAEVRKLRKDGWTVKPFTLRNQLLTVGGIGSGHPEISEVVNVYGFDAYR